MKALLLLLLRGYQLGISPFLGQNCRFYPSCSNYAAEAIREHGALKGGVLAGKRLCKCHPWHPGGADPVPKRQQRNSPDVVATTSQDNFAAASEKSSSTAACGCGHS